MFRGNRWQLLAFVISIALFAGVLLTRPNPTPQPQLTATPSTGQVENPTPGATLETLPTPTDSPTNEALPTADTAANIPAQADDVLTFREAVVGQVQRLNPVYASLNAVDADITSLIFEGLTRIDEFGQPVGALAESWVVSRDNLEYVFRLRSDVLWQDGIKFTADDVIYTMSILRSPEFTGDEALSAYWRTIETEKLADDLVRFRLTQPLASFLDAVRIGILPEHALRGTTAAQLASHPFNLTPIGTGPYQLEALRTDDGGRIRQVDLRLSPVYRARSEEANAAQIERMSFRTYATFDEALAALERGEVDGFAARDRYERGPLNQRASRGSVRVYNGIEPTIGFVLFNWKRESLPVFGEARVRQALYQALDREGVVTRNLFNFAIPAISPMLSTSWVYEPNLPNNPPNVALARELLGGARIDLPTPTPAPTPEGGATAEPAPTASSFVFSFAIMVPNDTGLVAMAQEIANQWSQLGLNVTLDVVDNAEIFLQRLDTADFDAAIVELTTEGTADPDIYSFWHQGQYPDGKNYGNADDRTISELLEKARRDPNGINRADYYRDFQRQFIDRVIAIPLYYPLYSYAVSPRFSGIQLGFIGTPADRFKSIFSWSAS